ncbi:DUF2971 domain-containing protein [Mesorhizobium sp. B2-3-11]|uniref:DUF2971 domain-containing protein n=1 Tax=Mesorhizobium sp. B2-3-11 TaxID=2589953 RepID=UPI0015E3F8FD|nr:DUF2971 domain-containing protein [Mesorhizobium sp. B2-3-11]
MKKKIEQYVPMKIPSLDELDTDKFPIAYHYCSVDTFLSIAQYKTIRLSDINTMNDFSEMHWAYERFEEAANKVFETYDREFFDFIDASIRNNAMNILPFLSCFSTDGDVLSQWRAYADNGSGVSVGFDSSKLKQLSVRCAPVTYATEKQVQYFVDLFALVHPMWRSAINDEAKRAVNQMLMISLFDMCLMKNPAFSEEKEVRIARAMTILRDSDGWHLDDSEGSGADEISRDKQAVRFRSRNGGIVGYIDLPINGLGADLIREVVLGPRTSNNGNEISMVLNANGFKSTKIRASKATYR